LRFGSGRAVNRIDDPGLVTGQGRYSGDVHPEGEVQLVFVRSNHAHAAIRSIDTAAARALPGVLAVITGADLAAAGVKPIPVEGFRRPDGSAMATPKRRALAHERVRYVGEPVVAVVAQSRQAARDAAESVLIDYEELPAVTDPHEAMKPGAPAICPEAPDNISAF